ncbi:MAG: flagellar basal-body rod protein FlgB [Verrucomicrobia bacterium GWC2_42_7]|nr:MAG: flagellar basal-body rod protein FlgB [Verrucomicrobia bacterium GWC2_42_7]
MIEGISKENYTIAKKMLDVAVLRHEALASNIANAQTPGYKRNDISVDFESKLSASIKNSDMNALSELKPTIQKDANTPSIRPDGNNVGVDRELVEITKNSVQIDFINNYLSDSIRRIKSAITCKNM